MIWMTRYTMLIECYELMLLLDAVCVRNCKLLHTVFISFSFTYSSTISDNKLKDQLAFIPSCNCL